MELRCPPSDHGITTEPEPDWSFDSLLSEIDSIEENLKATSSIPLSFSKPQSIRFPGRKDVRGKTKAFVMRVGDYTMEDSESEGEEDHNRSLELEEVRRFNCIDLYLSDSDDSDYELALDDVQPHLTHEMRLAESALRELGHEHKLRVQDEIRNQFSALEAELTRESEKIVSAFARVEKYIEARREMDRRLDTQYQRKIAEALDNHLTAVQRDHEQKSQIEERKIRSDAAHEEAKRKEKALQEERLRQERARAELEAKHRAEEAKSAALESERRAARLAAEREAAEASRKMSTVVSQEEGARQQQNSNSSNLNLQSQGSASHGKKKSETTGDVVRAATSALNLEQGRLEKLKELEEANQKLRSTSNVDFSVHERHIARLIRQITGIKENVMEKSSGLVNLLKNSPCPQSIAVATFAKKVVSHCESPDNAAFACAHVIVLVTSQVPYAMDFLLAEFDKACIYTVPKHIVYSKSVFESKEAYYKNIGYREDNGKIESVTDYLKRLESYMKLYGALVQTEVNGVQNIHGPKEGWAWLARFLNSVPANMYTAVSLNAFLQVAGFALYRKYKSQFSKLLHIISDDFVKALRERQDPELNPIIVEIESYIKDQMFLQEPEGRRLQDQLLSGEMVPREGEERGRNFHYRNMDFWR